MQDNRAWIGWIAFFSRGHTMTPINVKALLMTNRHFHFRHHKVSHFRVSHIIWFILRVFANVIYRKFSNIGATPYRGAPPLLTPGLLCFWTFLAISQPNIVRFSFCKKPLEGENVLSPMIAPPKVFPKRPAPLLGNLRYHYIILHWGWRFAHLPLKYGVC